MAQVRQADVLTEQLEFSSGIGELPSGIKQMFQALLHIFFSPLVGKALKVGTCYAGKVLYFSNQPKE